MQRLFKEDERGVAALEFALVAPILVALFMGMLEFGAIFYTYITAEYATGDAARQVASNHLTATATSSFSQQVQTIIRSRLPKWAATAATATASSSGTAAPIFWTITTTIPMKSATPTNFFISLYGSKNITTTNVVQQEPTS